MHGKVNLGLSEAAGSSVSTGAFAAFGKDSGDISELIPDGDVAAAIATAIPESGVDVLMGVGGANEGVLAAAALKCAGGDFQGQLYIRNDEEIEAALGEQVSHVRVAHLGDHRANQKASVLQHAFQCRHRFAFLSLSLLRDLKSQYLAATSTGLSDPR